MTDSSSGLPARRAALVLLDGVLRERRGLDDMLAEAHAPKGALAGLEPRDRGFARMIVLTALRRHGQIDTLVKARLDKPLPPRAGPARLILHMAAAELVFLETPAHAAVSAAVALAKSDRNARHFAGLINAVLRRIAETGAADAAAQDAGRLNTPDWLWRSWSSAYGEETARAIATAHLTEPPLDLSVKHPADAALWAERLGGTLLPTGSVRLTEAGRIEELPGFAEGAWWVQDAAAALPVRLLGEVADRTVIDLCAAPGGKTAELAARGAHVTAVDRSEKRLLRVRENLARLGLAAETVAADATAWRPAVPAPFVLLDAPCTSTGTMRRHPDIPHLKGPGDVAKLAALQTRLLEAAVEMTAPGGLLVYCVCSLQPEEGERQIDALLTRGAPVSRVPVGAQEIGGVGQAVTAAGDLRTLPSFWPGPGGPESGGPELGGPELGGPELGGMDGFFAARLRRN